WADRVEAEGHRWFAGRCDTVLAVGSLSWRADRTGKQTKDGVAWCGRGNTTVRRPETAGDVRRPVEDVSAEGRGASLGSARRRWFVSTADQQNPVEQGWRERTPGRVVASPEGRPFL